MRNGRDARGRFLEGAPPGPGRPKTGPRSPRAGALFEALRAVGMVVPAMAPGAAAEEGRQLEEKALGPAEEWWSGTGPAWRLDEKRKTQSTGQALRDPERWAGNIGAAAPSLATMPAPAPFVGDVEGRGAVPQGALDAINEGVRELLNPESADRGPGHARTPHAREESGSRRRASSGRVRTPHAREEGAGVALLAVFWAGYSIGRRTQPPG